MFVSLYNGEQNNIFFNYYINQCITCEVFEEFVCV